MSQLALLSSFEYLCYGSTMVYDHCKYVHSYSIDFRRLKLTSESRSPCCNSKTIQGQNTPTRKAKIVMYTMLSLPKDTNSKVNAGANVTKKFLTCLIFPHFFVREIQRNKGRISQCHMENHPHRLYISFNAYVLKKIKSFFRSESVLNLWN